MLITLVAAATSNVALAQDYDYTTYDDITTGNLQFLIGAGALPTSGDPATFNLAVRGEVPVATGKLLGVGVVLPVEVASSGENSFGMNADYTALELAPSARLRVVPEGVVRFYGDLGFGIVHRSSRVDSWFGNGNGSRTTGMTRSALGMEIGGREPGNLSLVLEPIGFRHYGGLVGDNASRFVMMAGIQIPM